MHDVDLAARLQPANECVADRVITADRDEQRIARGDPPGGLGDPLEVAIGIRALDPTSPTSAIVTPASSSRSASTSYHPAAPPPGDEP